MYKVLVSLPLKEALVLRVPNDRNIPLRGTLVSRLRLEISIRVNVIATPWSFQNCKVNTQITETYCYVKAVQLPTMLR